MEPTHKALELGDIFTAWQFWVCGFLIYAIIAMLSKVTETIFPGILKNKLMKAFVTFQPFCWGLAFAAQEEFLPGHRFMERGVIGLVSGALSNIIYSTFMKQVQGIIEARLGVKPAPDQAQDPGP